MWGAPNNLSHLFLRKLFGGITNPLSFEQSIINRLVTDFLESFVDYSPRGCEFQVYLDENPYATTLDDLPLCPIWRELRHFIGAGVAKRPNLEAPLRHELLQGGLPLRVSYNRIFLSMAITRATIPFFRETTNGRVSPEYCYAQKTSQLRTLARAIFYTQDFCKGKL